jgi:hypothetical protein
MTPAPRGAFRAYFAVVGLFALWVGTWGYLAPAEVGRALPWTVPPLHARFIAAMYLAGALAMALSLWASRAASFIASVRIATALAALWTGALLIVSLLRLEAFDFGKPQVWFWMGAYAVYPLWGGWLYLAHGAAAAEPRRSDPLLLALGAVCLLLAAALALLPQLAVRAWPWAISPLLATLYAGPFFAYGVSALLLAMEARREARTIVLASMLAFALLTLLASLLHRKLFRADAPGTWAWFGLFVVAAAMLAWRLVGPATARTGPSRRRPGL